MGGVYFPPSVALVAGEKLLPLVYEELHGLAAARMASGSAGHTLQPTALVHEMRLRLPGPGERRWQDRAHCFRMATINFFDNYTTGERTVERRWTYARARPMTLIQESS